MEEMHMLENHMIQQRGFKNVSALGQVVGFQVRVRIVAYKGMWADIIGGAEIAVDGEAFTRNQITWTIGDHTFTQEELLTNTNVHWQWTEPATLTVSKPGGLKPGNHNVKVSVSFLEGTTPRSTFTRDLILV
jgi:hypothetical protein